MSYDHRAIEAKWQKYWEDKQTFKVDIDFNKPKYYVLDMFPYPSGSGLHVGHVEGYTASDILARYKRQKGFNILHPIGWDSFGLPAEQYAVRTGTHPAITTENNIANFKRQLKALGISYDWSREFATSDPDYYKWTQWIFTLLYEKGLAYESEQMVNFCPFLNTVLANEEIENGKSKEGGYAIERRPLRQWMLKITAYAERLLKDLELLDWPESLKKLQINWIGKSEGAKIDFLVEKSSHIITVFTTRPDTLFGCTYMVLAPEHPFIEEITSLSQKEAVDEYKKKTSSKSDLDRTDLAKEKTGVFTGTYAINPANGQKIPIWIADYVLMGYGTGAIMAVPAHDERDFEFAQKFHLQITAVFDPKNESAEIREKIAQGKLVWGEEGTCVRSENKEVSLNDLGVTQAKEKMINWLEKSGKGVRATTYKLRDWLFSRQRYWGEPFPILHLNDGTKRVLTIEELPLCPPELTDFKPSEDGKSPLARVTEWVEVIDPVTGQKSKREINTMPQWAGSCWYYIRFCDPHNQDAAWSMDAQKYWLPVDMYIGGVEHAVLHLLYARFWHKVLFDCGYVSTSEPFQTLRNQGLVVARSYQNEQGHYVDPIDVMEKNGEYYDKKSGEKLKSQIDKMSKSKLNGVSPDSVIEEYGADSLRLYEMFMGPLEKEKIWNTDAVNGCRRFLNRFYEMVISDKLTEDESEEALKLGHRLIYGVTQDVEQLLFNTAIAKMMEFMNAFTKLSHYPKSVVKMAIQALAPFAPHLAQELWQILECSEDLSFCPYPAIEQKFLEDAFITYVVQVNGKVRGRFELPKDQGQEAILEAAKKHSAIAKFLAEGTLTRVVFVPNKLLNLVIQ